MKIITVAQTREMERIALKERGISSTLLMERAASAVTEVVKKMVGARQSPRAVVFCGTGNNGGDGIGVAYMLLEAGWHVDAYLVGKMDKMTPNSKEMESRLDAAGGHLHLFEIAQEEIQQQVAQAHVLVDALFGPGLNTPLHDQGEQAVLLMNSAIAPVVSVDIPSGIEADTGMVLGCAVEADYTVVLTRPKMGHYTGDGMVLSGEVEVVDIGMPEDLVAQAHSDAHVLQMSEVSLPKRVRNAYKRDFGHGYIVGGCVGYTGAPVFCARAAVRMGVGLVSVGVPVPAWPVVAGKLLESMCHPLPAGKDGKLSLEAVENIITRAEDVNVCLIGPGLGRGNGVFSVVRHLIRELDMPIIIDADGINALKDHIDVLEHRRENITILTPHDGEFARLLGRPVGEDRVAEAKAFAVEHSCYVVLKGYRTITALPDGRIFINATGNPGMATGGSGDALSGMILGLLAQGFPPEKAVPLAVLCHGRAGDLAAEELGEYSMTPSDLVTYLPQVLKSIVEKE